MGNEPAVELKDVVKRFGNVTAVNHVSLEIKDGEFFSLLGPSGCGKTTTLRMIAGFEMPSSGEVFIGGEAQGYLPAFQRPVNTVFQHYALFPHMTVSQNVGFGLEMKKIPKAEINKRVEEVLEMVHLKGMGNRRPKQLSGGQQQRVALARALVNHPKVLLLDEPLGALDLKLRKAMQGELKSLQDQVGITFIYVTHDQEEALTMSDRIGVMDQGRLLQIGTAREVYEAPTTRFVSDFIGDTNYLYGRVAEIRDMVGEIVVEPEIRIWAQVVPGVEAREQVSVAFRPEKVKLNADSQENCNEVTGTVRELVYTGSTSTFNIELAGGQMIMARQQNIDATFEMQIRTGDKVKVSWPIWVSKAFAEGIRAK
jgi:spermidine/putrescine transport system ATP-binding protein